MTLEALGERFPVTLEALGGRFPVTPEALGGRFLRRKERGFQWQRVTVVEMM